MTLLDGQRNQNLTPWSYEGTQSRLECETWLRLVFLKGVRGEKRQVSITWPRACPVGCYTEGLCETRFPVSMFLYSPFHMDFGLGLGTATNGMKAQCWGEGAGIGQGTLYVGNSTESMCSGCSPVGSPDSNVCIHVSSPACWETTDVWRNSKKWG